jgi:predicted DsbA family dithiol-disulfide isomerase
MFPIVAKTLTTNPERLAAIAMITIDFHSDPVCPWCFIGKRRLAQALELAGREDLSVRWRAFQLNPMIPPGGMDRGQYLAAKFGGADRARQVYDVIRREGESVGIPFAFARIQRTPNTVEAHRLLRLAARSGRADALLDGLFEAYFLAGRDIGKTDELVEIGAAAGLDGDIATFLSGDEEREEVLAEDLAARESGVTGVPHFVVAGRYLLPGAQSPEVIARAIELARVSARAAVPG